MDSDMNAYSEAATRSDHEAPSSSSEIIRHLRLDFRGYEYNVSLDDKVKRALMSDGFNPVIRGQAAPAAGAGLVVDIAVSVVSGIAADLIIGAIKILIRKIGKAANEAGSSEFSLCRATIETDECDFIITANASAGVSARGVDYNGLISQMMVFRETEAASGNAVYSIEAPCDVSIDRESFTITANGVGSYSLWLVTYRNGDRWPSCIYDAANNAFLPTSGRISDKRILPITDMYYQKSD